ncbi:hydroxylysine kinase-like [Tubulanus polymorphus]|uniref:hydroxylysine kinase-like n=1 Tax=Tubulanus polymorphus TaxID=672921 RepID=UPI003DA5AC0B
MADKTVSKAIPISCETAAELLQELYGLDCGADLKCLGGLYDANFYLKTTKTSEEFTLKILNSEQSKHPQQTVAQIEVMKFLIEEKDAVLPHTLSTVDGDLYQIREIPYERTTGDAENMNESMKSGLHLVRLQTFLPGTVFHDIPAEKVPSGFYYQLGESIANLQKSLLECPVNLPRVPLEADKWNLINLPRLRDLLPHVKHSEHRQVLDNIITEFEEIVLPNLQYMRSGILHCDLNEKNTIISELNNDQIKLAFIDYGDCGHSYVVFDLAIALMHFTYDNKGRDIFEICREILRGYATNFYITEAEKRALKTCICARFTQGILIGSSIYARDPTKTSALDFYRNGWSVLETFCESKNDQLWSVGDQDPVPQL